MLKEFYNNMNGIFSGQKQIHNSFLNFLGLHVYRILIARMFYKIRTKKLFSTMSNEQKILRKDGIIILKNFYPDEKFKAIKHEFDNANNLGGAFSEIKEGDSIWTRYKFSRKQLEKIPNTKDLLSDKRFLDLVHAGEARLVSPSAVWFDEVSYPEKKIKNQHDEAEAEKTHVDVFYHAHKAMYFINDVKDEDGPFNFSPGTHHLFFKRLWFEYKKSVTNSDFQANEEERVFLGLNDIKATVPANTLVVFDGCAFHRRGDAKVGAKRSAIFFQFRYNPFSLKTDISN